MGGGNILESSIRGHFTKKSPIGQVDTIGSGRQVYLGFVGALTHVDFIFVASSSIPFLHEVLTNLHLHFDYMGNPL
jgi:hypothetical protein